uniref:Uncharacterized protein n=1 Tax=Malurus cyaneus samueli TaxID=2593467 RepID=A0A8C5U2U2_9PASS
AVFPPPEPRPISARARLPRTNRTEVREDSNAFGAQRPPTGPPLWRGLPLGSPLRPPKPVVITEKRLCHRGLFNREVKSLDVQRLLTPGPGGDASLPIPQIEEGEAGGIPAKVLQEAVASLASLLASSGVFLGRNLVSERRRSLMAALRRHHHGPPDLGVFLTHRTPAQPPGTADAPRGPTRDTLSPKSIALPLAGQETFRILERREGTQTAHPGGCPYADIPAGPPPGLTTPQGVTHPVQTGHGVGPTPARAVGEAGRQDLGIIPMMGRGLGGVCGGLSPLSCPGTSGRIPRIASCLPWGSSSAACPRADSRAGGEQWGNPPSQATPNSCKAPQQSPQTFPPPLLPRLQPLPAGRWE